MESEDARAELAEARVAGVGARAAKTKDRETELDKLSGLKCFTANKNRKILTRSYFKEDHHARFKRERP